MKVIPKKELQDEHLIELCHLAWKISYLEESGRSEEDLKKMIYLLGTRAYRRLNFAPKALSVNHPCLSSPDDPASAIEDRKLAIAQCK